MLRSVIAKGVGVGAAVAATGPSTSQCRAQPAVKPSVAGNSGKVVEEPWMFADLDEGGLVFQPAEIADGVDFVMGLAPGSARSVASSVIVTDMDTDTESVASSANEHMYQADRSLMRNSDVNVQVGGLLNTMLANPNVQRECMKALQGDPVFSQLLENFQSGGSYGSIAVDRMLRDAAASAAAAAPNDDGASSGKNPLQQLVDAIGEGLQHVGHKVTQGCNAAGDVLISLGFQLRSLLRRPFSHQTQATRVGEAPSADPASHTEQWLTKVLMYVACAVMALLIVRRAGRVACA